MERKLGLAVLAAVVAFVVILFGIQSYCEAEQRAAAEYARQRWGNQQAALDRGWAAMQLNDKAALYALIGAVAIGGLALVLVPSRNKEQVPPPQIEGADGEPDQSKDKPSVDTDTASRLQQLDKLKSAGLITEEIPEAGRDLNAV